MAATASPGLAQTVPTWVGTTDNASISFLLALATLLVIPAAVILVGFAAAHFLRILARDQLVIADVIDATNLTLKDEVHGLSQSVREGFCLEAIESQDPGLMPEPADSVDNGLTPVTDALKGSATSPLGALLVALTALVPPIGSKVDTWLTQDPGASPRLRFDARIAHLGTGNGTVLKSIVGSHPVQPATVSDQVSDFAIEAGRWLAIQLWRWRKIPPGSPTEPDDRKVAWRPAILLQSSRQNDEWARDHFAIGRELLRLAGAPKVLDREALYLEALDEFEAAAKWLPDANWPAGRYLVVENRATAMSYLSVVQNSPALSRDAVKQYDAALAVQPEDPYAQVRIQLERGIAQLGAGERERYKEIKEDFDGLHCATALYDGRGIDVLYTAACWSATYAQVVTGKGPPSEKDVSRAAEYLALALALQPDLARSTTVDPDLGVIRPITCSLADSANWLALSRAEKDVLGNEADQQGSGAVTHEDKDDLGHLESDLNDWLTSRRVQSADARALVQRVKEIREYARKTASDWMDNRSTWPHFLRWPW